MIRCFQLPRIALIAYLFICASSQIDSAKAQDASITPAEGKIIDQFLQAFEKSDPKLLTSLIDPEEHTKLVNRQLPTTDRIQSGDWTASLERFGQTIINQIPPDAALNFLRSKEFDGQRRLQFRIFGSFGVNYFELILTQKNGVSVCSDIWMANVGETLSEMAARMENRKKLARKYGGNALDEELKSVVEIRKALFQSEFQKALDLYESLNWMKNDRLTVTMRLQAAAAIGGETFTKVKKSIEEQFGESVAWNLVTMAAYIHNRQFPSAIACAMDIERAIGPDAYLSYIKGDCAWADNDRTMAKYYLIQSLDFEPGFFNSANFLLQISLQENNFRDTKRWLLFMERHFDVSFEDKLDSPEFEEFKKSPEYQQWLKEKPKTPATQSSKGK